MIDEQIIEVTLKLKESPGDEALLIRRAELYRVHEEYDKARQDLKVLLARSSPPAKAFFSLATLERDRKDFVAASKAMERYLSLVKNNPLAYREAARYYSKLGRSSDAAESWSSYFKNQKKERVAAIDVRDAAESYLAAGKGVEARSILGLWIASFPHSIELTQVSAKCFLSQDKLEEAQAEFKKLRERYCSLVPRLSLQEGLLYQEFGKVSEAKEAWGRGLKSLDERTEKVRRGVGAEELRIKLEECLK